MVVPIGTTSSWSDICDKNPAGEGAGLSGRDGAGGTDRESPIPRRPRGKYPEGHMLISIFRDQHVTCLPNTPMRKVTSSTWLNYVQPPHGHTQG